MFSGLNDSSPELEAKSYDIRICLFFSLIEGECLSYSPVEFLVTVCRGKTATLAFRITSGDPNAVYVTWRIRNKKIVNGEHYRKGPNAMYLNVSNALPVHAGLYFTLLKRKSDNKILHHAVIHLTVRGKITVPCPFTRKS